jgi:hypothetical protein
MAADQSSGTPTVRWQRLIALAGWWVAALSVMFIYLSVAYPEPSPSAYEIIRIAVALVAASIAASLPGSLAALTTQLKIGVTVATACALFAAVYLLSPARFVARSPADVVVSYTVCIGEYERNCGFPHDAYLYCYADVGAWAKPRCASSRTVEVTSHDGNKCGYTGVRVLCKTPSP